MNDKQGVTITDNNANDRIMERTISPKYLKIVKYWSENNF